MFPWYALHVASCSEALVSAKLEDVGIESYYPVSHVKSARNYRPEVEKVYFPGYVFARFEIADRVPVLSINQVIRILGCGHEHTTIPDVEIAAIRCIIASGRGLAVQQSISAEVDSDSLQRIMPPRGELRCIPISVRG